MTSPFANLVIAGVTKAGTTALLHYLAQHPDICGERHKESQLLLGDGGGPAALAVAYSQQFGHCHGEPWRLESSPAYFPAGPDVLQRMGRDVVDVRALIVLRDPVQRIWSGYRMKQGKGLVAPGSFADFVAAGLDHGPPGSDELLHRVFDTSRYATHLRPWLEALDDRLMVLFFEDLVTDTPSTLRSICSWLDIDPRPVEDFDLSVHNPGVLHRSAGLHATVGWINRRLAVPLRRAPWLRSSLLRAYQRVNATVIDEQVDDPTRAQLRAAYDDDAVALRRLLADHGHDRFPAWLTAEPDARSPSRSSAWSSAPRSPTSPTSPTPHGTTR